MRFWLAIIVTLLPLTAQAQFKRYFDVSGVQVPQLAEPDWARRVDDNRARYLCMNAQRCASPTGIDIKGVVRGEALPEAFENGPLSPAKLAADGEATAARLGSRFHGASAITVTGRKGVQMEASADMNGQIYFVTRWIGQGDRLLDVKVTARDLTLARELAERVTQSLVPQVFDKR